jgi:hypothetical protein
MQAVGSCPSRRIHCIYVMKFSMTNVVLGIYCWETLSPQRSVCVCAQVRRLYWKEGSSYTGLYFNKKAKSESSVLHWAALCVCVCVCVLAMYVCVCMYVCMYVCVYVMYVCVCMYVRTYVRTYVMCLYVCVYVCMYVCMYVMYVCVCVCMYACMYVYRLPLSKYIMTFQKILLED